MFNFVQNLALRRVQGTFHSKSPPNKQCPPSNPSGHRDGGYKIYKYMTFLVGIPAILAAAAFTYIEKKGRNECEERPEFVPYEFMRRRTKRFPWGDGNKSFFHNPTVNPLPEGYEEDLDCGQHSSEEQSSD